MLITIYLIINILFAALYFLIGVEHLSGLMAESSFEAYLKCFFFSTQTFTTVGYGAIAPDGILVSMVASLEAMCGLLSFALATGLLWGRFSRPKSKILFSKKALIAPYNDGWSLQFRIANTRKNVLMEIGARVLLVTKTEGNSFQRTYYNLDLEMPKVSFLPLSWTVVHPINEKSPIYKWTQEDYVRKDAEILVMVSGFDDTFNQIVHARNSHIPEEIIYGGKYKMPFNADENGMINMIINDIHEFEEIKR